MVRPIRILFEGAYYHVMNRGQGKRYIFLREKDYTARCWENRKLNVLFETLKSRCSQVET